MHTGSIEMQKEGVCHNIMSLNIFKQVFIVLLNACLDVYCSDKVIIFEQSPLSILIRLICNIMYFNITVGLSSCSSSFCMIFLLVVLIKSRTDVEHHTLGSNCIGRLRAAVLTGEMLIVSVSGYIKYPRGRCYLEPVNVYKL